MVEYTLQLDKIFYGFVLQHPRARQYGNDHEVKITCATAMVTITDL